MFKVTKRLMAMLMTLALCVSVMGMTAFAENDTWTVKLSVTDASKASSAFSESDPAIEGLDWDKKDTLTWDGGKEFDKLTKKDQRRQIDKFFDQIDNAGLSAEATNKITDMLNQTADDVNIDMSIYLTTHVFNETKGDVVGGMRILSGFLPYINIIIGIGAILLISLLVLSTVIDLACLGLPAIRNAMLEKADSNGSGGGGGNKPKAITYAAWATINEVEGGGEGGNGSGKNAYITYFKKRVVDYIVLGICISFLIFGGFANVVEAFMEIGSHLVG